MRFSFFTRQKPVYEEEEENMREGFFHEQKKRRKINEWTSERTQNVLVPKKKKNEKKCFTPTDLMKQNVTLKFLQHHSTEHKTQKKEH